MIDYSWKIPEIDRRKIEDFYQSMPHPDLSYSSKVFLFYLNYKFIRGASPGENGDCFTNYIDKEINAELERRNLKDVDGQTYNEIRDSILKKVVVDGIDYFGEHTRGVTEPKIKPEGKIKKLKISLENYLDKILINA